MKKPRCFLTGVAAGFDDHFNFSEEEDLSTGCLASCSILCSLSVVDCILRIVYCLTRLDRLIVPGSLSCPVWRQRVNGHSGVQQWVASRAETGKSRTVPACLPAMFLFEFRLCMPALFCQTFRPCSAALFSLFFRQLHPHFYSPTII